MNKVTVKKEGSFWVIYVNSLWVEAYLSKAYALKVAAGYRNK